MNSCGIYLLKGGIRSLSKGNYLTGTVMKISCERGYTLYGWDEFYCNWNTTWLPTNGQWIEQFRDWPYCERILIFCKLIIKNLQIKFIIILLMINRLSYYRN